MPTTVTAVTKNTPQNANARYHADYSTMKDAALIVGKSAGSGILLAKKGEEGENKWSPPCAVGVSRYQGRRQGVGPYDNVPP
eukprot:3295804-Ditylum_brightwellii.AAC.1